MKAVIKQSLTVRICSCHILNDNTQQLFRKCIKRSEILFGIVSPRCWEQGTVIFIHPIPLNLINQEGRRVKGMCQRLLQEETYRLQTMERHFTLSCTTGTVSTPDDQLCGPHNAQEHANFYSYAWDIVQVNSLFVAELFWSFPACCSHFYHVFERNPEQDSILRQCILFSFKALQ